MTLFYRGKARSQLSPPVGESSNPFDTHEDLRDHWAIGISTGGNNVLSSNSKGSQVYMQGGANSQYIQGDETAKTDLKSYMDSLRSGRVIDPSGLSNLVHSLLTANPANTVNGVSNEVKMGDYVFINTNLHDTQKPTHGLVVVGWNEAMNCDKAIFTDERPGTPYKQWTIADFSETYATAQSSNPVPWVTDFTSPPDGSGGTTQSPVPRPFYCTMYWEDGNGIDRFAAHNWYFFTLPDHVEVSTQPNMLNQLYIDPDWQWAQSQ